MNFQKLFEFGVYILYFIYASLFLYIVALNEIFKPNFDTTTNCISFVLAIITCSLLTLLMILPIFIIICARKRKTIEIDETTEVDGVMKRDTFIEKLHYNLLNGLKQTTIPSLYPTFAMLKRLAIALTVLLPENKYVQIGLFSGIHVMFVVYLCIARPFVASFYNIMIIINELVMIAIIAMMYSFLSEGDPKDGIGMAINILVIINIILIFAVSI